MSENEDEISEEQIDVLDESKISDDIESDKSQNQEIIDDTIDPQINQLKELLSQEKQKTMEFEGKLQRTLADFQNLERKTKSDIQNGLNLFLDEFMANFLQIYDDFVRAKDVFTESNTNTKGLDSILKNMDALLSKYNIESIDALGEIFDPKIHEAISVIEDSTLDDDTVTKEIRKGYISQNRVIRPALVEISKKTKTDEKE